MMPGIEVAICTYNGAARLPAVFAALKAQSLSANLWSVLVVDNGSTDGTAEKVPELWGQPTIALRVVVEPRPGVTMARQRAFAVAEREVICFCDDDNLLASDYLEQAYARIAQFPKIGALGGQGMPVVDRPLPPWFAVAAAGYAVGPQAETEGPVSDARGYVYGAGMVIRRAAWDPIRASGYELRLRSREGGGVSSGEDNEICLLLQLTGWEVHYSPRLVFRHLIGARKLEEAYCRALYRGFGEASPLLNVYRDFALGRAQMDGWRRWACLRWAQGVGRSVFAAMPLRPRHAIDDAELRRETACGYASGFRRLAQEGGLWRAYAGVARSLRTLPRPGS